MRIWIFVFCISIKRVQDVEAAFMLKRDFFHVQQCDLIFAIVKATCTLCNLLVLKYSIIAHLQGLIIFAASPPIRRNNLKLL